MSSTSTSWRSRLGAARAVLAGRPVIFAIEFANHVHLGDAVVGGWCSDSTFHRDPTSACEFGNTAGLCGAHEGPIDIVGGTMIPRYARDTWENR